MGIATERAPAPSGGMKPYTLWEIDVRLFNDAMVEIGKLTCRQDLWVGEGQFAVRLTPLGENNSSPYEDRGSVDGHGVINGVSGFGGRLEGRLLQNNGVRAALPISFWWRPKRDLITIDASGSSSSSSR